MEQWLRASKRYAYRETSALRARRSLNYPSICFAGVRVSLQIRDIQTQAGMLWTRVSRVRAPSRASHMAARDRSCEYRCTVHRCGFLRCSTVNIGQLPCPAARAPTDARTISTLPRAPRPQTRCLLCCQTNLREEVRRRRRGEPHKQSRLPPSPALFSPVLLHPIPRSPQPPAWNGCCSSCFRPSSIRHSSLPFIKTNC